MIESEVFYADFSGCWVELRTGSDYDYTAGLLSVSIH